MSLLDEQMSNCTMIDRSTRSDGYGGVITEWSDGAGFKAAVVEDDSIQARTAQVQGVKSVYTVTTRKAINLQFHDVFRREEDGKIFRVTSDGDDKKTPKSASLDMRNVSAEEWSLPNG